ncbi:uncharacterized protein LOC123446407 [Hordeum vulgare subsp. vulgare]|uniref:uncharacterized protein LOC123446407 n=1 Tax=Hordeum vulgare subsp. vulgare TaxID=112509 RepID=UPI00162ED774|nr:uncharacterized protein LOC123446407 [Hordeum vulgare subsp. vulgare]
MRPRRRRPENKLPRPSRCQALKNREETKMTPGDGTNSWFARQPQAPPWDALEYNKLISAGPLLPRMQQYANIGYGGIPWKVSPLQAIGASTSAWQQLTSVESSQV